MERQGDGSSGSLLKGRLGKPQSGTRDRALKKLRFWFPGP